MGIRCTAFLVLLLAGCGGASVAVPTNFPVPIVEKIPLPIGIHIDENLSSYTHTEVLEGRGEWQIELGTAQQPMFQSLLEGMFYAHQFVDQPGAGYPGLAAVLVPSIEELQFSTQRQTRTKYFEVWIRYQFICPVPGKGWLQECWKNVGPQRLATPLSPRHRGAAQAFPS